MTPFSSLIFAIVGVCQVVCCARALIRGPGLRRPFVSTFEKGEKPWKARGSTNEKAARKGAIRGTSMNEQTTA